jgi:hypothetical protein
MTISECVRSSPWWGVVKSLGPARRGPVGLIHAHRVRIKYKKPTLGRRPIHVCLSFRIEMLPTPSWGGRPVPACARRAVHSAMNRRLLWEGVFSGSATEDCGVASAAPLTIP